MFSAFVHNTTPLSSSLQEAIKSAWAVWSCCFAITFAEHDGSPNYELWENRSKVWVALN